MLLLNICSWGLDLWLCTPPAAQSYLGDGGQWEGEHNVKSVALFCWVNQMSLASALLETVTLYVN